MCPELFIFQNDQGTIFTPANTGSWVCNSDLEVTDYSPFCFKLDFNLFPSGRINFNFTQVKNAHTNLEDIEYLKINDFAPLVRDNKSSTAT